MHVCVVAENHAHVRMAGAEYQTILLTEELARRPGVRLTFLARRVPVGAAAEGLGYAVRCIGDDTGIHRRAVLFDAGGLRRALQELKPDVIYQQGLQSYTAVCAHYANQARIPFFFHIAHEFDLNFRWVTLRLSPNTPFDLAECLAGRWGARHASHVIVQTEKQGRILQQNFGRTATSVVRNFQPLPETLPPMQPGPLTVFWVANFKDFKRPWLFVELAESFAGRDDLVFLMAGRAATERRFAPLMQRIPQVPNLRYVGEQPIENVNELMSQAAFHVNTSSFEGFPNTFLQAWARGAIVTTLAVDPDDGMEAIGIGYCAGSMQRLHDIIDELAKSEAKRRQVREAAFQFVHTHHSMKHGARLATMILEAAAAAKQAVPALAQSSLVRPP
jgi:hypothetical protein